MDWFYCFVLAYSLNSKGVCHLQRVGQLIRTLPETHSSIKIVGRIEITVEAGDEKRAAISGVEFLYFYRLLVNYRFDPIRRCVSSELVHHRIAF